MQNVIDLEIQYLRRFKEQLKENSDAYKYIVGALAALQWVNGNSLNPALHITRECELSIGLNTTENAALK